MASWLRACATPAEDAGVARVRSALRLENFWKENPISGFHVAHLHSSRVSASEVSGCIHRKCFGAVRSFTSALGILNTHIRAWAFEVPRVH